MTAGSSDKGTVVVIATLDSKGHEAAFAAEVLRLLGYRTLLLDAGTNGTPQVAPDIARDAFGSTEAGAQSLDGSIADILTRQGTRLGRELRRLYDEGAAQAFLAIGGGKGTSIAGIGMRSLPIDAPRVIVSCARPNTFGPIVREHRIVIVPTSTDIAGLNTLTRSALRAGAYALDGLVRADREVAQPASGRIVAVSSFGATTPAVQRVRERLQELGCEAWVFPATGVGGRALETYVAEGKVDAVIDLTTAEVANHLFGGTTSAGESRLEAAGEAGIPQIVVPGAADFLNFNEPSTIPASFDGRTTYNHTPFTTLVRTSAEENFSVGRVIGEKLARAKGPVAVLVPTAGYSVYDRAGEAFWQPEADRAWVEGLESTSPGIPVVKADCHINDPGFADTVVKRLLSISTSQQ